MLIKDIINETTSSGGIATVAQPMGKMQRRPNPSVFGKRKKTKENQGYLSNPNSNYARAVADYCKNNPGKTEEDFKLLTPKKQEQYLDKYLEGKSPHKKGTKKYKKHMAAMHAG